ncbi:MAG: hypothetical protein AAGD86_09115, partial [Pseudomonadota bacterium]
MKRIVGEFRWIPPGWLQRLGRGGAALLLVAMALLAAIAVVAYRHYDSLPKPPRIVAEVTPPGLTPLVDGRLVPEPLVLDFAVVADEARDVPQEVPQSVARLDLVDKAVSELVTLTPPLDGEWRWDSGTRLRFTPTQDWPAGETYTVRHPPALFAPTLELADDESAFTTPPFTATLDALEFYQDPVERTLRKVIGSLSFSHPVDSAALERRLSLTIAKASGTAGEPLPIGFEVQLGEHRRTAHVHSVQLAIAPQESFVALELTEGLTASRGPARLEAALSGEVRIPDSASYFRVAEAQTLLARNADNEPVQQLALEFTDDVTVAALQQKLRVWLLPDIVTLNGETTRNKRWQSPREVTPDVLTQATRVALTLHPTERDSARTHSAAIDVPEGRQLYVAIVQGLTSAGGFELTQPYDAVLRAPSYPKEAGIAQDGAVLPLTGSHRLTLYSRGVSTLKVELGRVIDSELYHLASQTNGDITNPYFTSYAFGPDNLTERFTRFIDVNAGHARSTNLASLDLTDLLGGGGFYFVNVQGWDRARNAAVGAGDQRVGVITGRGRLVQSIPDAPA